MRKSLKGIVQAVVLSAVLGVLAAGFLLVSAQSVDIEPFNVTLTRPGTEGGTCVPTKYPGAIWVVGTHEVMRCNPDTEVWDLAVMKMIQYAPALFSGSDDTVFMQADDPLTADPIDIMSMLPSTDIFEIYTFGVNWKFNLGTSGKTIELNPGGFNGFELFINGPFSALPTTDGVRAGTYRGYIDMQTPAGGGTYRTMADGVGTLFFTGKDVSTGSNLCREWWDANPGGASEDFDLCRTAADTLTLAGAEMYIESNAVVRGSGATAYGVVLWSDTPSAAYDTGTEICALLNLTCEHTVERDLTSTARACGFTYSTNDLFWAFCK